jgi:hypothetical protein
MVYATVWKVVVTETFYSSGGSSMPSLFSVCGQEQLYFSLFPVVCLFGRTMEKFFSKSNWLWDEKRKFESFLKA